MAKQSEGLGPLLVDARRALGVEQQVLAARIGATSRTLSRWERHGVMPTRSQRERVAVAYGALDPTRWRALVAALELDVDAMLARVPEQRDLASRQPSAALAALDDSIRVHADLLDVTARRLRMAVASILSDVARMGIAPDVARDLVLAGGKPPAR